MHRGGGVAPTLMASASMHLIGRKAVSLATGQGVAGQETALLGNDIIRSATMLMFLPVVAMATASLVGGVIFLLAVDVGPIALSGLCVMACVLVGTGRLAARSKTHSQNMLREAEYTVGALREMVEGAKVAKLMVWEMAYAELVKRRRSCELVHLRRQRMVTVVIMGMGRASPILANCVTFVVLYLATGKLEAAVVFPAMQVYPHSLRSVPEYTT